MGRCLLHLNLASTPRHAVGASEVLGRGPLDPQAYHESPVGCYSKWLGNQGDSFPGFGRLAFGNPREA